jgi:hypothetical protein
MKKSEKVISSGDMIDNYMRKGTLKLNSQRTQEIQGPSVSIKEKPVNHLAVLMEAIEKKKKQDAMQSKKLLNDSDSSRSRPTSNRKSARKNKPEDGASSSRGTKLIQNMLSKKLEEKFSSGILQSLNKYGF